MQKDILIIRFQRKQCLIEIYSGHIQIPAQDCKNKDITRGSLSKKKR